MDRLAQLAQGVSKVGLGVPLLVIELALMLAILVLLVPILFIRRPEPFDRLIVLLELVMGRSARRDQGPIESARSEPPAGSLAGAASAGLFDDEEASVSTPASR